VPSDDRLRGFLELLQDSLSDRDLTGSELAARAHLSRFHFDRLVSGLLGEPPATFRRRVLLERAAYRLTTSAGSVLDVAIEASFGSSEAFSRAFARAFGVTPSRFRDTSRRDFRLAAPSGIHFHPPGGLRLPASSRSTTMDVATGMLDHHLSLVEQIIDRADRLDAATLDTPIDLSVESIGASMTLRGTVDRLVGQLEMWVTSLEGGDEMPHPADSDTASMRSRLAIAGPKFRELVLGPITAGKGDDIFLDAMCDPPRTFSYAGVLAHVLTFAAFRRTIAIGALESAGVDDLGAGDPMHYVGGVGVDASQIRRHRTSDALG
jgi:AraC family transcriptional regulator